MKTPSILSRLRSFIEFEARSCSMDPGCITPEYVFRMWGGTVPLEEIRTALKELRSGTTFKNSDAGSV